MKDCILCGKQTEGSVGAAGYKWSFICQPCKDSEDKKDAEKVIQAVELIMDFQKSCEEQIEEFIQ